MLSPEERDALDELRAHYPSARAAIVSVLKWLQKERGHLSDETLRDAAEYLGEPLAHLEGLATFYNLLYRRPVGRHVILLCDSVSCWICGCSNIQRHLEDRLGVGLGETTGDGEFTLLPMVCLGDCDHAPVMMVDDDLHRDLTPERVDQILVAYREGEGHRLAATSPGQVLPSSPEGTSAAERAGVDRAGDVGPVGEPGATGGRPEDADG